MSFWTMLEFGRRMNGNPRKGIRVLNVSDDFIREDLRIEVGFLSRSVRVIRTVELIRSPWPSSELHLVDERIVALAPTSLDDAAAVALSRTSIAAYELLFDPRRVPKNGGASQTLLRVGGAGAVGSILVQLARELTQLTVVATASRQETGQWCLDLGGHAVIDHRMPLSAGLQTAGIGQVDYVAALTQTGQRYAAIVESLNPRGASAVIDDTEYSTP